MGDIPGAIMKEVMKVNRNREKYFLQKEEGRKITMEVLVI